MWAADALFLCGSWASCLTVVEQIVIDHSLLSVQSWLVTVCRYACRYRMTNWSTTMEPSAGSQTMWPRACQVNPSQVKLVCLHVAERALSPTARAPQKSALSSSAQSRLLVLNPPSRCMQYVSRVRQICLFYSYFSIASMSQFLMRLYL